MSHIWEIALVHVFVPTNPNPTSGFFLMLPPEDLRDSGLTVPEGFALLISAGVVGAETSDNQDLSAA